MCRPRTRGLHMQLETKFLPVQTPVTVGSRFGEWHVTWAGGWTRGKLSYLVMVVRVASPILAAVRIASTASSGIRSASSSPAPTHGAKVAALLHAARNRPSTRGYLPEGHGPARQTDFPNLAARSRDSR